MGFNISSGSVLGSSIETAEITDGSITAAKMGTGWIVYSAADFTSSTTLMDEQTLPDHKYWRVTVRFKADAAKTTVYLHFNEDNGNNYEWARIQDATADHTGSTSLIACSVSQTDGYVTFSALISTDNETDGQITAVVNSVLLDGGVLKRYLGGTYNASADLSSIQVLAGAACTGNYTLEYLKEMD